MESLFIAIENVFFRIAVPPAVLKFLVVFPIPYVSKRVRKIMEAYKTLQAHMLEMISSVRASVNLSIPASTREAVLLKDLVEANARQEGERKHLSDDELLSNIFVCIAVPISMRILMRIRWIAHVSGRSWCVRLRIPSNPV
jgi:hypothetical protein